MEYCYKQSCCYINCNTLKLYKEFKSGTKMKIMLQAMAHNINIQLPGTLCFHKQHWLRPKYGALIFLNHMIPLLSLHAPHCGR